MARSLPRVLLLNVRTAGRKIASLGAGAAVKPAVQRKVCIGDLRENHPWEGMPRAGGRKDPHGLDARTPTHGWHIGGREPPDSGQVVTRCD